MTSKEAKTKKTIPKGAKGKGKPKTNDLTKVDRTFYELTINDLNNKLSSLRTVLRTTEDKNYALTQKLEAYEVDRTDVANHLQELLKQRDELLAEREQTMLMEKEACKLKKTELSDALQTVELKNNDMKCQLLSEIKLLKGQLSSLNELQRLRDDIFEKYEDMKVAYNKRDQERLKEIFELKQNILLEGESIKAEVENKLIKVSEDFRISNETRNASHTQRILRENFALRNEVQKMIETQFKMQRELSNHKDRSKTMREEHILLKESLGMLSQSGYNKYLIIEKLTNNYERLKKKYVQAVQYQRLYENYKKRDSHTPHYAKDTPTKLRALTQKIQSMNLENSRIKTYLRKNEYELKKLRELIHDIKFAIKTVIVDDKDGIHSQSNRNLGSAEQRWSLLQHLTDLILRYDLESPPTSSIETITCAEEFIYQKGNMGIVPQSSGVPSECTFGTIDLETKMLIYMPGQSTVIPKERIQEAASITDVEWGPSLDYSEHEDLGLIQMANENDESDYGEEKSSSISESNLAEPKSERATGAVSQTTDSSKQFSAANVTSEKYSLATISTYPSQGLTEELSEEY